MTIAQADGAARRCVVGTAHTAESKGVPRIGGPMAGSSYDRHRMSLGWVLALIVILSALTSGAIAVATSDSCGGYNHAKEWRYLPPHWVCR